MAANPEIDLIIITMLAQYRSELDSQYGRETDSQVRPQQTNLQFEG